MNKIKKAFTLAEIMVVLLLLGVVAAVTIPSTYKNVNTRANKTKIKKAFSVYERFIERAVTENNIPRNKEELNEWGSYNNCQNIRNYFKAVQSIHPCSFKTADGIWWDFGSPQSGASTSKVLVALKRADLNQNTAFSETDFKAFYMITDFDSNGAIRVADMNYFNKVGGSVGIINTAKLMAFINGKKISDYYNNCGTIPIDERKSCIFVERWPGNNYATTYYNENGEIVSWRQGCDSFGENCTSSQGGYGTTEYNGITYNQGVICNKQGDGCVKYMTNALDDSSVPNETKNIFTNMSDEAFNDLALRKNAEMHMGCDINNSNPNKCKGAHYYFLDYGNNNNKLLQTFYNDENHTDFDHGYLQVRSEGGQMISVVSFEKSDKGGCTKTYSNGVCCKVKASGYSCPDELP